MTPRSATAIAAARRVWARDGKVTDPEAVAADVERLCSQLDAGLTRWIGTEGYRALLDRALDSTRPDHPALKNISCRGRDEPAVLTAVRAHGGAEMAAGIVAMVATLIDLLGRIIGEEMAVNLVEQAVASCGQGERNG